MHRAALQRCIGDLSDNAYHAAMHTPPEFGERLAGQTYTDRPGVYALAFDEGKLLCIKTPAGIYLHGGGIDLDEDPREALRRECREETGWAVADMIEVSRARQLVVDSTGKGWSKDCRYFLTTVAPG